MKSSTPIMVSRGFFGMGDCAGEHKNVEVDESEDLHRCKDCKMQWTFTYPPKTDARVKAFRIFLAATQPMRPKAFARKMWPDSPAWSHHTSCGPKGTTTGGGMPQTAGSYIGKLRRQFPDIIYFRSSQVMTEGWLVRKERVRELFAEWGVEDE